MSNRRRPLNQRRTRRGLREFYLVPSVDQALARLDERRCPDCDSEFGEVVRYGPELVRVQVRHDETCPWLAGVAG